MDPGVIIALVVAGLLIGATGTWSPCGFSMVETIGPTGHTGGHADDARRLRDLLPRRRRGRRLHLRRHLARRRRDPGRGRLALVHHRGRGRPARRDRRGSRQAHRAADPPPAPRALAPHHADAGRRGPLRDPARAGLYDLRPHLRRVGACRDLARAWRAGRRPRDRPRLRRRPRDPDRRARSVRERAPSGARRSR